jgi:hypothetical protein
MAAMDGQVLGEVSQIKLEGLMLTKLIYCLCRFPTMKIGVYSNFISLIFDNLKNEYLTERSTTGESSSPSMICLSR